jgi:hypothetical protein
MMNEESESKGIGKKKSSKKKKLEPYIGSNKEKGKYYYDEDGAAKLSYNSRKKAKELVKNANRSMKKSARQEAKDEIRDFLSNKKIK